MMAVGANDEFVRLYDRRNIKAKEVNFELTHYLLFETFL